MGRVSHLPGKTTYSGYCGDGTRHGDYYRRRNIRRSECLAGDGRYGTWVCVGDTAVYVAPDWSADWLHRECTFILDSWSIRDEGKKYAAVSLEHQALYRERLSEMMRKNTFDPQTGNLVIDSIRGVACRIKCETFFGGIFRREIGVCYTKWCIERSSKIASTFRFLFLDIVGCFNQSTRR